MREKKTSIKWLLNSSFKKRGKRRLTRIVTLAVRLWKQFRKTPEPKDGRETSRRLLNADFFFDFYCKNAIGFANSGFVTLDVVEFAVKITRVDAKMVTLSTFP